MSLFKDEAEFDNALTEARGAIVASGFHHYDESDKVGALLAATLPPSVMVIKTDAGEPDDCPVQAAPHSAKRRTSNPPKPKKKQRPTPKPAPPSPGRPASKPRPLPLDDEDTAGAVEAFRHGGASGPPPAPAPDLTALRNVALMRGLSIDIEGGSYHLRYGRPSRASVHRGTLQEIADYLHRGIAPLHDGADDLRQRLAATGIYSLHRVEPGLYSIAVGQLEIVRGDVDTLTSWACAKVFGRPPDPRFNDYRKDL